MKKMYILLVALSILPLAIDVNAQPYKPCLVEGAEWRGWFFVPRPCKSMMKSYEYTYGELIIKPQRVDDKYWSLSFVEAEDYYKPKNKNNDDDWYSRVYRWEDVSTGKLYVYIDRSEPDKDMEYLIMDMSLEVGDKWNDATVVKVYNIDGRKHIEFDRQVKLDKTLHEFSVPYTFIEGVGPNAGFGSDEALLSCKYEDGKNVYTINHPTFDGCSMLQNRIDDTSVNDLSNNASLIYPNPVKDIMTIENVAFDNLQIHDLTGKVMKTLDSYQSTIDVSDLKSGVYFVNIHIDGNVLINKIVKL